MHRPDTYGGDITPSDPGQGLFGVLSDGRPVQRLVIGGDPRPEVHLLTLGATLHRLEVTAGDGRRYDVVLGHPDLPTYLASPYYLGAVIGRYANRIRAGRFVMGGQEVRVPVNDRGHALHGGPDGFDRRLWEVREHQLDRAVLRLVSPDGDMGFPGRVEATATYEVTDSTVRLTLAASTDAPTVVNLTSHAYVNLDGGGTIDGHRLWVPADRWTPVDDAAIPTGTHEPVDGTPFDLREPALLSERLAELPGGYDHNLVVAGVGRRPVAALESSRTGLRLELLADQPGLQLFTSGTFDGSRPGVDGTPLPRYAGVALEPQLFPDSPNHPDWPSALLAAGDTYRSVIEWSFSPLPPRPPAAR
ncbi:MAG TPA: aldose epimerase family protein [Nocardioides sp.]|uniref:aldose epimerase family protein n=1 Tax=Nocardioides sp. TaxID=35761 RepID=UPI002E353AAC|nr:aldose epimerase family protein [Nocardioides sp.]HEX5087943.1 aldose epimerase family protein [Nocardioides sp.]